MSSPGKPTICELIPKPIGLCPLSACVCVMQLPCGEHQRSAAAGRVHRPG